MVAGAGFEPQPLGYEPNRRWSGSFLRPATAQCGTRVGPPHFPCVGRPRELIFFTILSSCHRVVVIVATFVSIVLRR
jgi:hypothetical protein